MIIGQRYILDTELFGKTRQNDRARALTERGTTDPIVPCIGTPATVISRWFYASQPVWNLATRRAISSLHPAVVMLDARRPNEQHVLQVEKVRWSFALLRSTASKVPQSSIFISRSPGHVWQYLDAQIQQNNFFIRHSSASSRGYCAGCVFGGQIFWAACKFQIRRGSRYIT